MTAAVLVSGVVSSLVSIMGTILALHVVAPAVVDAQEARVRAERVAIVDGDGTERAIMSSGPGVRAAVRVHSSAGFPRIDLATGGQLPQGGTEPDHAQFHVYAPEGPTLLPIAVLGTANQGEGSLLLLRDRQEQTRISLRVDRDGNPSIEMRDADGNVTWRAE